MTYSNARLALTDTLVVLLVISVAWIICRWWIYPFLGVADNAPVILRPICGFLAAWWLLHKRGNYLTSVGLRKPEYPARAALVAISLYVVLSLTSPLVSAWLASVLPADARPGFMTYIHGNLAATLCWIAIGWIVGGFCEEVLFRGFLLSRVALLLGGGAFATGIAVVAQALLFGSLHFYAGAQACAHAAYFALLMGSAYLASARNLWPSILVHGIWNTLAIWSVYSS